MSEVSKTHRKKETNQPYWNIFAVVKGEYRKERKGG